MTAHQLSPDDRAFLSAFATGAMAPAQFDHEAHVRLAYGFLADAEVEAAVRQMRDALRDFLRRHQIPPEKFHETMTRAWILAVRHFMDRGASTSFQDFITRHPELLDTRIMLTHYSAAALFSPEARAAFREPDLEPIPRAPRPPAG